MASFSNVRIAVQCVGWVDGELSALVIPLRKASSGTAENLVLDWDAFLALTLIGSLNASKRTPWRVIGRQML